MKSFAKSKPELLQDKHVVEEHKKLAPRYRIVSQLISARLHKNLTQQELATKLGTKQPAIARLESGSVNPSLDSLEKIAAVLGYRLTIQLQ